MKSKIAAYFLGILVILMFVDGCLIFTERDYKLQEISYQREREIRDRNHQDRWGFKW